MTSSQSGRTLSTKVAPKHPRPGVQMGSSTQPLLFSRATPRVLCASGLTSRQRTMPRNSSGAGTIPSALWNPFCLSQDTATGLCHVLSGFCTPGVYHLLWRRGRDNAQGQWYERTEQNEETEGRAPVGVGMTEGVLKCFSCCDITGKGMQIRKGSTLAGPGS